MSFSNKAVVRDGQFVSERVAQIIEAIREYSPELQVEWIPPEARDADTAAFRIMHYPSGGQPYPIFTVKSEAEFDARVLMRIIAGDQRNGEVTYSDVEAAEKAAELIAKQRFLDQIEEANDIAAHVFRSRLNTYRVSKDLVIKDGVPYNAAPRKRP